MRSRAQPWNWNLRYHRLVIGAVPPGATTAVDVGSGDGLLTFDLADRGLSVVGIDADRVSVEGARAHSRAGDRTRFVVGDVLTSSLPPTETFDIVASIAMLHHVDAVGGLRRMRALVRPGGVVAIVGFARPSRLGDRTRAVVGIVGKRLMQLRGRYWEHTAPKMWPPPHTTAEMRSIIDEELPGARFRPLLSGRFGVVWIAPE